MKTESEYTEETLKVPLDMVMEVFTVIAKAHLKHEVVDVIEKRSLFIVEVRYNNSDPQSEKAFKTAEAMLSEYGEYRSWQNEDFDWKEE